MKPLAILTDLDGTLADTFPSLRTCAEYALEHHQLPIKVINDTELRRVTGQGAAALLQTLSDQSIDDQVLETMLSRYSEDPITGTRLYSGTEQWFDQLPVGVVTNKPRLFAQSIVEALCPEGTLLVCPEDTGKAKPDPSSLKFALQALQQEPQDVVYIGDDIRDWQAATAASIDFVAAAYGYGWDGATQATNITVIDHPDQLLSLLC